MCANRKARSKEALQIKEHKKNRSERDGMKERKALERVLERVYKDKLRQTGRLPDAKETRAMEKKVREAAENADNRNKRG